MKLSRVRRWLWYAAWRVINYVDQYLVAHDIQDVVDRWETNLDMLEKLTGCRCRETEWPDGLITRGGDK